MGSTDLVVKSYIRKALEHHNFLNLKIGITGYTDNSEGYISNIAYASVVATTKEGSEDKIELAVKMNKIGFMGMYGQFYTREAYLYETIFTEFSKFQVQNNIKSIFNSVPKCYKTISEENSVAIVMENLKKGGYRLYDRTKPLDLNHLRLLLREFGKFHAISFAMREKTREYFENLVCDLDDVSLVLYTDSYRETINYCMRRACKILKENNETELYAAYTKIDEKGIDVILIEALTSIEPETVVVHGDSWNNNFAYKYENDDNLPTKVAIMDWQLSRLHSPAIDVSYLIYSHCSEEQFKHFDEFLEIYYTSFSTFLGEMGCDSNKLFPFSTLQKHMKKYSIYGLVMILTFLHVVLCDEEDAPDFGDNKDGKAIAEGIMSVPIKNDIEYRKRLISILRNYYKQTS